ncbi:2-phospho-L-lactate guanylyltransferase [Krasilnikovia cinnamomea]|uniref:Phosphoenolpyruvate guanylyltransferase n=1 Tax=Krasilnikovia cinnamomea TaxID=349313 RepID=A0A4Q7ZGC3_9ACTN|nr:2-phospho-L-lactate guanylyltransferase [Krasilnikovia cinnamomea]
MAVIPVKRLGTAKSRLRGAVAPARHAELALAMLRDTVAAVLDTAAVAELLVVTDDPDAAGAVAELGARPVPDHPAAGLNAALRHGADTVAGLSHPRVVLAGDLPALRPEELAAALSAATTAPPPPARADGRAFVADAAGTGTVLLAAPVGVPLGPRFGPGSAGEHAASGARPLAGEWPGLRQDVDTPADLRAVLALGAGAFTCGLLRSLGQTEDCAGSGAPAR